MIRTVLEQRLSQLWYGGSPWAFLLRPLAALYGAALRFRRGAYVYGWLRSCRVRIPVVVVGNLTVGGTGKTPLVIWLVEQLALQGLRPCVLSRGYGRATEHPRTTAAAQQDMLEAQDVLHVVHSDSSWEQVGDEPLLIHRRTGCVTVVGPDRVAAARAAADFGFDVLVTDDGLQHLPLARDCEIVVVDGTRGFGNGRLLPAGPLREPASRLSYADVVVVNGEAEHPSLARALRTCAAPVLHMRLTGSHAVRVDQVGAERPLEEFRGEPVHAVAGIGHPERFFRTLRAAGLEPIEHRFADHHPFTPQELAFADGYPVLMTEKDAVRCRAISSPRLWYLPVAAQLPAADAAVLLEHVARACRARGASAR